MLFLLKQIKFLPLLILIVPFFVQADDTCYKNGYTILTLNGIFTKKPEAEENMRNLSKLLPPKLNNQVLKVDFLHNESHLGGLGDIVKVIEQSLRDNETVSDYDLTQMLYDASQKVTTQKVLIVAHSQGNFYANSFYDVVAGQTGGIPRESIGVYAVATPSGRTSGNGLWLTSTTDKVIAGIVGGTFGRNIMPPNITINIPSEDASNGHSFSGAYLKYAGSRVVSDIEKSLTLLKDGGVDTNDPCINPPKISLGHKLTGAFFVVADPLAGVGIATVSKTYDASSFVLETSSELITSGINTGIATAIYGADIIQKFGVWAIGSTKLLANSIYSVVGIYVQKNIQTEIVNADVIEPKKPDEDKKINTTESDNNIALKPEKEENIEAEIVDEKKKEEPPKIIYLEPVTPRSHGGGTQKAQVQNLVVNTTPVINNFSSDISIEQCDESLSVSGCLLATTTVNISWESVSSAEEYFLSINNTFSTTTSTSIVLNLDDFDDYVFSVRPVFGSDADNNSTTTSASFSLATIPVAINEVAFLGTIVEENDEWIELKNNTNHSIDLSNWAIQINNGETTLPLSGVLGPKDYVLVMRGENAVTLDNGAMLLSWDEDIQGILNDTGEKLVLFYRENNFDSTPFWSEDNLGLEIESQYESLERKSSRVLGDDFDNWDFNLGFIKNGKDVEDNDILGTPGEHNSLSYLINDGETMLNTDITLDPDNGPYAVFDTIIVSASSTLVIPEGVEVKFIVDEDGIYGSFLVLGKVEVGGDTETTSFTGEGAGPEGFFWFDSDQATSTFNNVVFENTETIGLINSSKVEIQNSEFINNGSGINAYNGASLILENVTLASTTGEAVAGYNSSHISIASSTVSNTFGADGIAVYNNSVINIDNVVVENSGNDGIAVYNSTANISSTTINTTGNNGLALYTATTTISNLDISNTEESGLIIISGITDADNLTISEFNSDYAVEIISPADQQIAEVTITDSIVVGEPGDILETGLGSVVLENVDFCGSVDCVAD